MIKFTSILVLLTSFSIRLTFGQDPVSCNPSYLPSNWKLIGPVDDYTVSNMGRAISVWVSPNNPQYILLGTRASGLWKSTDGGANWSNLTGFQLPACGVQGIAVYDNGTPLANDDRIYLATQFLGTEINEYSVGIAFSNNNGISWQYDYSMDIDPSLVGHPFTRTGNIGSMHLFLKPGSSDLYVLNGPNIYVKNLTTSDWTFFKTLDDFTTGSQHYSSEIDFLPENPNFQVISSIGGSTSDVYYTPNAGLTWLPVPTPAAPVPPPGSTLVDFKCSAVCANATTMYIYYCFSFDAGTDITISYLYQYDVSNPFSISIANTHDISGLTSGYYADDNLYELRELLVCPDALDMCFIRRAQGELFKADLPNSSDPIVFYTASRYYGANTHADIRAMAYYQSDIEDYIFIAHDGGISRCATKELIFDGGPLDNDGQWVNINGHGLAITEFNAFSNSELEDNKILASSGDGNGYLITKDPLIPNNLTFNNRLGQGDYERAKISPIDPNIGVYHVNGGFFKPSITWTLTLAPGGYSAHELFIPKPNPAAGFTINDDEAGWSYRPFDFDKSGNFFEGTVDIFQFSKELSGTFTNGPANTYFQKSAIYYKDLDVLPTEPQSKEAISTFIRVENWPLLTDTTYYIATKGPKTITDNIKFVRSIYHSAGGDPYEVNDRTPNIIDGDVLSQINYSWITDIVIDPHNPLEIWIAFGGTKMSFDHNYLTTNSREKSGRVYYSMDGGLTWINRSIGLPNYPVLTLEYWNGTNDVLFAGTDVGVFIWHKTPGTTSGEGAWECFNDNLPYCSVNDLEINNCSSTLRASTFGFGIWETPLPIISSQIEITGDINWTQSMDAYSDIVIHTGARLTIVNCEVRMRLNGKIIVENGGALIVDGGTITNHCDFWQGIEVWGKGNSVAHPISVGNIYSGAYPVDGDDHGVVFIKNGGTIENAVTGITTFNSTSPTDNSFYGGIIVGNTAIFHNNQVSIDMRPYDYSPTNTNDDNISEFVSCNFIKDETLPCETICPADVFLTDVDGIDFRYCNFTNTFNNCIDVNYPIAIKSINATYRVEGELCEGLAEEGCEVQYSNFSGYYRAIYAANTAARPRNISIYGVNFTNNERAVLFSAVTNSDITRNNFKVPDYSTKTGYGLYLEGCINYQVEGNYFTKYETLSSSSNYCSGILIENNSNASTEIYRNTFEDIEIGMRSQGNNSKLQIHCNTFLSPIANYNIIVTSGTLGNQGICNASITQPAGNQFSHDGGSESDFRIIPSITLNYRHHTESIYIPNDYTTTKITLHNCNVSGDEDCASTLGGGTEERMMMTEAANFQEAIDVENEKIDGGNTELLISDISGGVSPSQLYYELTEKSPYLSDKALQTLVQEEPLVASDLLGIMGNNYPISDSTANTIESSNYEVSPTIVQTLNQNIINDELINSPMNDLLATIDVLETKRQQAVTESISDRIKESDLDSAFAILNLESGDWAIQNKIGLLASTTQYSDAFELLNNYNETDQNGSDFKVLYSIILSIDSSGRLLNEISLIEESIIRNIANKETPAGVAAQNILSYVYRENYPEIIDDIPEIELRKGSDIIKDQQPTFKVFPNPTDEIVYIQLNNIDLNVNNIVNIYNLTGIKIKSQQLRSDYFLSWLSIIDLQSGLYIIEILSNNVMIGSETLVVE